MIYGMKYAGIYLCTGSVKPPYLQVDMLLQRAIKYNLSSHESHTYMWIYFNCQTRDVNFAFCACKACPVINVSAAKLMIT